jgi:uracil-DNA glycosylase
VNIHEEVETDCGIERPDHGSLEPWAHRGVLLLNAALTVPAVGRGRHTVRWVRFTDAVIRAVTEESDPVFLLWGEQAQGKEELITRISGSPGKIIKSSHPSPLSARRPCGDSPPFLGSRPFGKANEMLRRARREEIDWGLSP